MVTLSNSSTRAGWTVGGGLETRLQSNWLLRAEYRYADFGSVTYQDNVLGDSATYEERVRTHTALVGLTYQFGPGWNPEVTAAAPLPVKAQVAPVSNSWSGAYAGLDIGLRSTATNATENGVTINGAAAPCVFAAFVPPQGCVSSEPMNGTAFRFGGFLGYDWQFAPQWLAGVEGQTGIGRSNRDVQRKRASRQHQWIPVSDRQLLRIGRRLLQREDYLGCQPARPSWIYRDALADGVRDGRPYLAAC